LDAVGLVLVEGDEDEGVVHEALVFEERGKEGLQPFASDGDGGVVTVGGHVGGDEHPLGELVILKVGGEHGCVLDLGGSLGLSHDRVVEDLRASIRQ